MLKSEHQVVFDGHHHRRHDYLSIKTRNGTFCFGLVIVFIVKALKSIAEERGVQWGH